MGYLLCPRHRHRRALRLNAKCASIRIDIAVYVIIISANRIRLLALFITLGTPSLQGFFTKLF